jgi:hypothetical protein
MQNISGVEHEKLEKKEQKFEKTLDKYYINVDNEQSLKDDQKKFQEKVDEKICLNALNYFH